MEEFLSFYENVDDALKVSYLKLLLENDKNLQNEFKAYIKSIYNSKPRLPALREELKKAGLIEGF